MFSEYVLEELSAILVNNGNLIIVDRKEIDLIRSETNFQWSGEVSDASAQEIGQLLGAQSIISGSLSSMGDLYRFRVKVLNVQTAQVEVQYPADVVADNRVKTLLSSGKREQVTASGSRDQNSGVSGGQPEVTDSPQDTAVSSQPNIGVVGSAPAPAIAQTNSGTSIRYEQFTALRRLNMISPGGEVVFTPDSKAILAYDDRSRSIKLWDVETGKEIRTIRESRSFRHIAISPDGRRFVTDPSSSGNMILLWDFATGAYREIRGHTDTVKSLSFSPDGSYFISGSYDKTIKIWSTETGQEVKTLTGHTGTGDIGRVLSVTYSPDGRQIVSCSNDRTIKFWDASNGNVIRTISANCSIVSYCPDGRKIAAVEGNKIHIFDTQNGRELFTLTGHRGDIQAISFSPEGSRLLSVELSSTNNNIIVWNMSTGWEVGRLNPANSITLSFAISADGKYLASARNNIFSIWGEE
jgi:WD40 repeat protein